MSGVAIVSGGGQGIGQVLCHGLAKAGHAVAVADINVDNARRVADAVTKEGGTATAVELDVTDEKSIKAMEKTVSADLGDIVAVVNNAALFSVLKRGPYTEIDTETWNQVMNVNTTGVFLMCRELSRGMAARGYGKIVNIASGIVHRPQPGYVHYVASKAAVFGITRAIAVEAGAQGVRVNTVCPGPTETEIERQGVTHEILERIATLGALKSLQTAQDLVGAVAFLCSPASDFITGQHLNVDGGLEFA